MNRRTGIASMAALSSFLLCGAQSSPTSCKSSGSIGPSNAEVVGVTVAAAAVIVVGVVVLVEVNKSHHTIKGCVLSGPDGIQVENEGDKKIYALVSSPANVKVGDIVKLHGNKEKKQKDSGGNREFMVQRMSKDYGPCKAPMTPPAQTQP